MSLDLFYGDASCIDVSHKEPRASINAADIDGAIARSGVDVRKGDILLFYTGTSAWMLPARTTLPAVRIHPT